MNLLSAKKSSLLIFMPEKFINPDNPQKKSFRSRKQREKTQISSFIK
ncbi:hypothetical protein OIU84_002407 [Salix udensis]|uniref:Uncharacterized protein n=1 Tax=Salix udensis TaxID=889485 RepID=A0AAD6K3Y9_9ROSI|nr:hypothetical protein OIU84_002407 [Salix udensis]